MSRVLYNEGRVVGYSAYEIYVKQYRQADPEGTPSGEKEWLAASLAMGASLLLRVGSDNISGAHYRDIEFPEGTSLTAANIILASFFFGQGDVGSAVEADDTWSTKVIDYGNLISNTAESSPSGSTIPTKVDVSISDDVKAQLLSYANITDGIVIQPGTWSSSANKPPEKTLTPTLTERPMLRISFADKVNTPFFMILTGFTDKGILVGETSLIPGSVVTPAPQNGDFLGPAVFPWSAKVVFSIPPYAMQIISTSDFQYDRKVPVENPLVIPEYIEVDSIPIVDFKSYNPSERDNDNPSDSKYGEQYDQAKIQVDVRSIDVSKSDASVICSYSVKDHFQPSLYGAIVSNTGIIDFYPFDCYAPDTLHMYQGYNSKINAKLLESSNSGARAFSRDFDTLVISEYDRDVDEFTSVANVDNNTILGMMVSEPKTYPLFYVQGDLREGISVKWNGSDYPDHIGGTAMDSNLRPWDPTGQSGVQSNLWYLEIDGSIKSEYIARGQIESIRIRTGQDTYEDVDGIPGTVAINDTLCYTSVGCLVYRRLTGRLSEKIKDQFGWQNIYDQSGNAIGEFGVNGVWENNPYCKYIFEYCIDGFDRHKYYAIFTSNSATSAYSYPVRSQDNFVDVTDKYIFRIYVNGSEWNIPHFENDQSFSRPSSYLGTWFNANTSSDKMTADSYSNKWAKIFTPSGATPVVHPTAYSAASNNGSGQAYQEKAMLPVDSVYTKTMKELFDPNDEGLLTSAGILAKYQNMSVLEFLQTALYTDMGTGKTLPASTDNVHLSKKFYTNGYDSDSGTYDIDRMEAKIDLSISNSSGNIEKSQLISIDRKYLDDANAPVGTLITTGRKQAFVLSLSDVNNTLYNFYGTSGEIITTDPGLFSWSNLLTALAENKSVNVIGNVLSGLAANISGSGKNYIEFADAFDHPIRIYVSTTEPSTQTGDIIPNGSVGLGWGTGIHTYTNGAWSQ